MGNHTTTAPDTAIIAGMVENARLRRENARLREALSALTAAARKEATYNDTLHRRLWLYIERAEKVLQEAGNE